MAKPSIVDSTTDFVDRVNKLGLDSFNYESPYGSYHISISEIEVAPLEKLGMDLPKVFKAVFHTPTILNSKLMSPPPLASKGRSGLQAHAAVIIHLLPPPQILEHLHTTRARAGKTKWVGTVPTRKND